MTLNVKSIEIYLDATATLTSEGLAEGALQVQDFRVKWTFNFSEIRVEIKQTRNNFFKIWWSKSITGRFSNHRTIYISIWVSE